MRFLQYLADSRSRTARGCRARNRFLHWSSALSILGIACAFFAPTLFQGRIFLAADTLFAYYPWKAFAPPDFSPKNMLITDPVNGTYAENYNRLLKEGRLVGWNPYIGAGMPACNTTSMGVPGRLYPLKLLAHRLLPTATALSALMFVHLVLMGYFMYLYLAKMGAGRKGALFGAVAYMLNGCAMVWLSFETVLPVGAFLPLLLLIVERFAGPSRLLWSFIAAAVFGMMILMGHTHYVLYVIMMMGFYAFFLLLRSAGLGGGWRTRLLILACFAITGFGGMLIGAAETIPVLEAISASSRASRTFTFQGLFDTLGRVPWRWFVTLIYPDYFGSPPLGLNVMPRLPGQEYMNYNELCLYLGVPTLFGLLAAAVRPRTAAARFYLAMTALLVAMMAGTWAFWPFFKFFPGMDRLNPTRIIFLFAFTSAAAAGFGFGRLQWLSRNRRWLFIALSCGLVGVAAALATTSTSAGVIGWFQREIATSGRLHQSLFETLVRLRSLSSLVILKPLLMTVGAAVLFALLVLVRKRRARGICFALILALLTYDLISFGWSYNPAVKPGIIYPRTPAIEFLQRQPGVFRVVQDTGSGLYVNTLMPFRIAELGGYSSVYPERSNRMFSLMEFGASSVAGRRFDRWVMFSNHATKLYDLFNVRYLLTAPGRIITLPNYRLAFRNDLAVWENTAALDRAFIVHRSVIREEIEAVLGYLGSPSFDPRREVVLETPERELAPPSESVVDGKSSSVIEKYDFDEVLVVVDAAAPGYLVLSDSYYPGWRAFVDERETPVLPANCSMRAVAIPAGRHTVAFRYRPESVTWGGLTSMAGFLLVLGGTVFLVMRRTSRLG